MQSKSNTQTDCTHTLVPSYLFALWTHRGHSSLSWSLAFRSHLYSLSSSHFPHHTLLIKRKAWCSDCPRLLVLPLSLSMVSCFQFFLGIVDTGIQWSCHHGLWLVCWSRSHLLYTSSHLLITPNKIKRKASACSCLSLYTCIRPLPLPAHSGLSLTPMYSLRPFLTTYMASQGISACSACFCLFLSVGKGSLVRSGPPLPLLDMHPL